MRGSVMRIMLKEYDVVTILESGEQAQILEISDDKGRRAPLYLVELINKPEKAGMNDVVFWCGGDEIQKTMET